VREVIVLDVFGGIFASSCYVAQVGLLIALMRGKDSPKLFFGLAAFLWLAVVVAIYGSGGPPPRLLGPIPINFLPFTAVLAVLFGSWPAYVQAMMGIAAVALAIYAYLHLVPYTHFRRAISRSDWPAAQRHIMQVPLLVAITLVLTLVTAIIGASGPYFG
jgi:hypothetical protein